MLPSGLVVDTLPLGCSQASQVISCTLGSVTNGGAQSITLAAMTTLTGTLVNTATVSRSGVELDSSNNSAEAIVTVFDANQTINTDLALAMQAQPTAVKVGEGITYTFTISNQGTATAQLVQLTSKLSDGVTFVAVSHAGCQEILGQVVCNLGDLAMGQTINLTMTVTAIKTGTWVSMAEVSAAILSDPVPANNQASATVEVQAAVISPGDLVVSKQVMPSPAMVGENITYTFMVTNQGTGMASAVQLIDQLPTGMALVSQPFSCDNGQQVVCDLGDIAPNEVMEMMLVVTAAQTGWFTNTTTVTSSNEADSSNNLANVTVYVGDARAEVRPNVAQTLTFTNTDGESVAFAAPAGAVSEATELVYTELATVTNTPIKFDFANNTFTLEAFINGVISPTFKFNQPLAVTVVYSDSTVAGLLENSLTLHYFDITSGQWVDAASSCSPTSTYQRDMANNRLTVNVCHLTQFALFGQPVGKIYLPIIIRK
jgi:uncharacterized repeat protein (TIGR01451 family)